MCSEPSKSYVSDFHSARAIAVLKIDNTGELMSCIPLQIETFGYILVKLCFNVVSHKRSSIIFFIYFYFVFIFFFLLPNLRSEFVTWLVIRFLYQNA